MRDKQIKYMNDLALQKWHSENEGNTYQSQLMLKLQHKLRRCNSRITLKNGSEIRTRCRSAICPNCSREYAIAQSVRFVKNLRVLDKNNCRFMTVVIGLTNKIEKVYEIFDAFRIKLRRDITNKCNRKDVNARLWQQVCLSGSMEIDSFMSEDFQSLGSKKRYQYEELLGYSQPNGKSEPVYVITGHIVIYKGRLSLKKIEEVVHKHAVYVHFRKLEDDQDALTAVQNCLGYASKVEYETEMENYTGRLWNFEQIQALLGLISCSRGRCKWGFSVKVKKRRQ